ncbi:MAG: class I SAM-dependent methyltransferase [Clostridia bacterium]|nr:class I SAM-dependent methyltransferase [Clostridia bacterium]
MKNKGYGKYFVKAYDLLNTEINYTEWCDFYEKCFEKASKPVKNVCETACGTGNLAIELSKRGYNVTALDISEEMLSEADKKAFDSGVSNIRFTLQDMCDFKLYTKPQAVICMASSINCLKTNVQLEEAFTSAYNALDDGGVFIFDVSTKKKFETVYADNAYILEDEKVLLAWQNYYNTKTKRCDFYLSFFFENENGSYDRYDEVSGEKMFTEKTIVKTLNKAGFNDVSVFCGLDFSKGNENTDDRLIYLCKKEEK